MKKIRDEVEDYEIELKRIEEERKRRIEEIRRRRQNRENSDLTENKLNSENSNNNTPVSSSQSGRRRITRKDTWVQINETVDEWEIARQKKIEQREREAAERKKQLEEELAREREERKRERERRKKERESEMQKDEIERNERRKKLQEKRERLKKEREQLELSQSSKARRDSFKSKRREGTNMSPNRLRIEENKSDVVIKTEESSISITYQEHNITTTSSNEFNSIHTDTTNQSYEYKSTTTQINNESSTVTTITSSVESMSITTESTETVLKKPNTLIKDSPSQSPSRNRPKNEISSTKRSKLSSLTKERIVSWVPPPSPVLLTKEALFVIPNRKKKDKKLPNTEMLLEHFLLEGRLHKDCAIEILKRATKILRKEPNVLKAKAPLNVIGDIHGQFFDLANLIKESGEPSQKKGYLFLGDYVDRGMFSCEVFLYVLALKIARRKYTFLLRGNHETRDMTSYHNFQIEVKKKYGEDMIELFMNTFDALPLACVVETSIGNFFCCHGGLSPSFKNVEDIVKLDRFVEPPDEGPICDIIWSDPVSDENYFNQNFSRNKERCCSYVYGYNPIIDFLEDNNFVSIIRAHQVEEVGYKEYYFSQASHRKYPLVITIFSAPNYCDKYENTAAYLELLDDEYLFHQFTWQSHPYCLPNFMNAFQFSMAFILENFTKIIMSIMDTVNSLSEDEIEENDEISKRIQVMTKLYLVTQKMRKDNQSKIEDVVERMEKNQLVDHETRELMNKVQKQRVLKRTESDILSLVKAENRRFIIAKTADRINEAKPSSKKWNSNFRKLQRNMTFKV